MRQLILAVAECYGQKVCVHVHSKIMDCGLFEFSLIMILSDFHAEPNRPKGGHSSPPVSGTAGNTLESNAEPSFSYYLFFLAGLLLLLGMDF
jgi:hypothetical protein